MSEHTREEILKLIEENGGPEGLALSGKDLSGIDLGKKAIRVELEKARERALDETPVWYGKLTGGVSLRRANLQGTNLQGANLRGADLQATYLRDANLQGTCLERANLQEAILWDVSFQRAEPLYANFRGADLLCTNLQEAVLYGAILEGAYLAHANFKGAILSFANLQGANLERANLQWANLSYSHLEMVDFFTAESLEGACFYNAFLDDTRLKREQLGGAIGEELGGVYDLAKEAYLALKNNFAEIGRYKDESWAYVKERQMGKMCSAPWRARRFYGGSQLGDSEENSLPASHPRVVWFYTRHTLKWLTDWFVELLCDYGESLWRVLAWMLLVVLGFAAYYQVTDAVVTSSQDAATSVWDHLIFSLGAFTTLQPARLQPARPGVELLTTIQAIMGISLAGLLGFVAGNRIRRS